MAAEDFGLIRKGGEVRLESPPLPVPLYQGLDRDKLSQLLKYETAAFYDASCQEGRYPLIVIGQGLYYESPLTQAILCEYLASHGYVVATCPLVGAQSRLVNLNVVDLEAQIRDMEYVISWANRQPNVDAEKLGIVGYDIGGMAGLILTMRNPGVDTFISLDSGILFGHRSGLPNAHPHYSEERLRIPWMHMTQERFVKGARSQGVASSLIDRKPYSDSYLLLYNTTNHADFTSYAMFGITKSVVRYWGPIQSDAAAQYQSLCQYSLNFLEAYLKDDENAGRTLRAEPVETAGGVALQTLERNVGAAAPPASDRLIHLIIEEGVDKALPVIQRARSEFPDSVLFDEPVLNWLGYHFLYWWGRQKESVEVFKLTAQVFPESFNAYDSLGEAFLITGDQESAILNYRRSLELNPNNQNAAGVLERLNAVDGD
jgi:dienelactone hydrolase